jgi:hypothetical protein
VRGRIFLSVAIAVGAGAAAVTPATAAPVSRSTWATEANKVCVVWAAKIKAEFGAPNTAALAYIFSRKAKSLESQERAALLRIPGRTDAGTAAIAALKADIAELDSAISAFDRGKLALFKQLFRRYLSDTRARDAFAAAGAKQCG